MIREDRRFPAFLGTQVEPGHFGDGVARRGVCLRFIARGSFAADDGAKIGLAYFVERVIGQGCLDQQAFDPHHEIGLFPHFTDDARHLCFAGLPSTTGDHPKTSARFVFRMLDQQDLILFDNGPLLPCVAH